MFFKFAAFNAGTNEPWYNLIKSFFVSLGNKENDKDKFTFRRTRYLSTSAVLPEYAWKSSVLLSGVPLCYTYRGIREAAVWIGRKTKVVQFLTVVAPRKSCRRLDDLTKTCRDDTQFHRWGLELKSLRMSSQKSHPQHQRKPPVASTSMCAKRIVSSK